MTRLLPFILILATGCATYSESAVAARMELSATNAEGIERANATLAAKVQALVDRETENTDRATFAAVLDALDDGHTTATLEGLYLSEVASNRASLAAYAADWQVLVDEFAEAAKNQRIQGRLSQAELEAARKLTLFKEQANGTPR